VSAARKGSKAKARATAPEKGQGFRLAMCRSGIALLTFGVAACDSPPAAQAAAVAPMPPEVGHGAVLVPTGLVVERTATTLSVGIDGRARAPAPIALDPRMTAGVEAKEFVYPLGATRPALGRLNLSSSTSFDIGTSIWNASQDGIPVPGTRYVVEMEITLFETDVAPQHMWDPHAGRYRALWTQTLRQTVE
jgi:hypothetical protein